MRELILPYHTTLCALVGVALLWIVQVLAVDIFSLRGKHVPGTPVTGGHRDPLFRVARAHANTNENLCGFLLCVVLAMILSAQPRWVNALAIAFFAARLVHMLAYYADVRLVRSVAFGAGLLATMGLAGLAAAAL